MRTRNHGLNREKNLVALQIFPMSRLLENIENHYDVPANYGGCPAMRPFNQFCEYIQQGNAEHLIEPNLRYTAIRVCVCVCVWVCVCVCTMQCIE